MPTLPDVSTQPSFFPSQAIIENGEIVGYSAAWVVYHRDTLTPMGQASTRDEALELADAAIAKMAELRAPQPPADPDPFHMEPQLAEPLQAQGSAAVAADRPSALEEQLTAISNFRHRYSIRANPEARTGEMVSVSFRLPENVRDALVARAGVLKAAGDPGIETPTDALQDAVVCWLLMEGVI